MAYSNQPVFPASVKTWGVQIVNADASAKKTLVTGGTNGSLVEMINITSSDTTARDLQFWLNDGTTDFLLTTITVAITAGNIPGTLPTGLLSSSVSTPYLPYFQLPLDVNGNRFLYVANGWTLKVSSKTTVTTALAVSVLATGGDF